MPPNRRAPYSLRLLISLMILALLAGAIGQSVQPAEAARRPTRTPRPTSTPLPTATPAPSPTSTPGPGVPGAWRLVDSPNVSGRSNRFSALAIAAANDLWAVGEHRNSNATNTQTLTARWDGSSWNIVASPSPDPDRNRLLGAAAVSADDVWAVGVKGGVTGPNWASLILHWDGNAWSAAPAPAISSPGTSELRSVAAVSANDVWAVGAYSSPATGWWNQPLILHWDGSAWSSVPAPGFGTTSELNAVAAASPTDVWAVGRALENNWKTLILHWDGVSWSRVPSPNLGSYGNNLAGVTSLSAADAWAVGSADNGNRTLALRWNGSTWNIVPSPNGSRPGVNRNSLASVTAVAPDDVWAVGVQAYSTVGGAGQPIYVGYALIEHWDGSTWSEAPAAALPGAGEDGELFGVAAVGAEDVWTAGHYYEPMLSTQAYRTLIQQYTVP